MGIGSFPGVKYGRGVLLTTHPLLVQWSLKGRAIPLPTLWATTGPVTGSLYLLLDGVGGQRHAPAALPPVKTTGTQCTGGWVCPGPVWTGAENLSATGIRSLDRPARGE